MNRSDADSGPTMTGDSMRHALGFDADESLWLQRVRESETVAAVGRIGHFELLDEIGRGGQGIVYRARQPGTGREIAVKRLSAGVFATPNMRARFEREIEASVVLDHPNIVTVFGTEEADGQTVLAMRYVDGQPIDRWARPAGKSRRDVDEILRVFLVVCDAVQHAHQRGVIHRDLKPSNILVDGEDRPFVLDFGLAKLRGENQPGAAITMTGDFLGTPAFAAPEQVSLDTRAVDVRTDVYSLGAVLYHLLTGALPNGDQSDVHAMLRAITQVEARIPSSIDPTLNREIDLILLKALSKDKEQRYASVAAFADDLRRHIAGEAVLAHPPSVSYRLRKFVKAHRAAVGGAALVAAVLLAATATSLTFYFRAERALEQAAAEAANARVEASKQKEIAAFITGTFAQADPGRTGGRRNVTVRESLDAAVGHLDAGSTKYAPETEAALRLAMSNVYTAIDANPEATALAEKSVALFRTAGENARPDLGQALLALAQIRREQGDVRGGIALDREALALIEGLPGDHRAERAGILQDLAYILPRVGDYDGSLRAARNALALRQSVFGEDHAETGDGWNMLSIAESAAGRHREGEEAARRAYAIHLRHEKLADAAQDLCVAGRCQMERGDLLAADATLIESIAMLVGLYGDDHRLTHLLKANRALCLLRKNELSDAAELLGRATTFSQRHHGPESDSAGIFGGHLGSVLHAADQLDSAETTLRESVRILQARLGEHSPHTLMNMRRLGLVMASRGNVVDAEQLLTDSLKASREHLGECPGTYEAIHALGLFYCNAGRFAESEPLLREAYEKRRQFFGVDHWESVVSEAALALLSFEQARWAEAESAYLQAIDSAQRIATGESFLTARLLGGLARTVERQGNLPRAESYFRRALELVQTRPGDPHVDRVVAQADLAGFLARTDRAEISLPLAGEGLDACEARLPASHPICLAAASGLGNALAIRGDFPRAEPLLLFAHDGLIQRGDVTRSRKRAAVGDLASLYSLWAQSNSGKQSTSIPSEAASADLKEKATHWAARLAEVTERPSKDDLHDRQPAAGISAKESWRTNP